jgi:sarcosine oxidase, subunit alpha
MSGAEVLVIGGGPAGLQAALSAAGQGAAVTLVERGAALGGQLVKQTHMFFGSRSHHATERGIRIAALLAREAARSAKIRVMTGTTALGCFEDRSVALESEGKFAAVYPARLVIAAGAQENTLVFPNGDLPGIYGAGAVQTLMNVHGVLPGSRAAMVGAGNIGLIVSYQLLQAGVAVAAVLEAAPRIGGYLVHASKIRRLGVPIYTAHTVIAAHGREMLEAITIARLDRHGRPVEGSERELAVDLLCVAVGLSPLAELLHQAGCRMAYIASLGGHVPCLSENMETTVPGIYAAGDACGVEEAGAALLEGRIAGLTAAGSLGYRKAGFDRQLREAKEELAAFRRGPAGEKIRRGLAELAKAAKEAL